MTGNMVAVYPRDEKPTRRFPHKTEDCVVAKRIEYQETIEGAALVEALEGSISPSIAEIFEGQLKQEARAWYVDPGTECASLGAVCRMTEDVRFGEDHWNDKATLKCSVREGSFSRRFAVSSKMLKDVWRKDGIEGLEALKENRARAHIRIGLAGAFRDYNSGELKPCYAMVNNIFFH